MENTPVIQLSGWRFPNIEDHERFGKWAMSAFFPIFVKNPDVTQINRYRRLKDNPDYCLYITTYQFTNFKAGINFWKDPEALYVLNDMHKTFGPRREVIWSVIYQLERPFYNPAFAGITQKDPNTGEAPAIHIEASDLPQGKEGDYYAWFSDIGYDVFISRIMKRPGAIGFEHYRLIPGIHKSFSEESELEFLPNNIGPAFLPSSFLIPSPTA